MKMLKLLPEILNDAYFIWEHTIPADLKYDVIFDSYSGVNHESTGGQIITGDNLATAKTLYAGICAETITPIKLIYMDPPFFTKTAYVNMVKLDTGTEKEVSVPLEAFSDNWKPTRNLGSGASNADNTGAGIENSHEKSESEDAEFTRYLTMLSSRIIAAREMLSEDGSLWIHLDHHAAHYIKVIADEIFGSPEHMLNEVIWQYKSGGSTKKRFARKHDTLLFYAKNPKEHYFSMLQEKSYNRGKKPYRFKGVKEYRDEEGWYTQVNMRDVWKIDMVGRTSRERTGYATQKPEALLERVVTSCSEKGDYCMDMFAGSGTLASVAEKNSRKWISIDSSPIAALHTERRMTSQGSSFDILSDVPEDSNLVEFGVDVRFEDTADDRKKLLCVKLTSYSFRDRKGESPIRLDKKFNDTISDAVEVNLAQIIGSLAIDINFKECFKASAVAYSTDKIEMLIKSEAADEIVKNPESLAIRVVDIFGNSFLRR